MALVPFDDAAFLRQLRSAGRLERGPLNRPQRWIQDEVNTQLEEVAGTSVVAERAMDLAREISVHQQMLFRQTAEALGAELDDAETQHATGTADNSNGQFTGTKDVPALLAAFAQENIKNFGSALLATQQIASRSMAEVVNRGLTPPEEIRAPRRGFWTWWTNGHV